MRQIQTRFCVAPSGWNYPTSDSSVVPASQYQWRICPALLLLIELFASKLMEGGGRRPHLCGLNIEDLILAGWGPDHTKTCRFARSLGPDVIAIYRPTASDAWLIYLRRPSGPRRRLFCIGKKNPNPGAFSPV